MNFKALQKKSKKTERQDKALSIKRKNGSSKMVRKYKRKKRYGHSIKKPFSRSYAGRFKNKGNTVWNSILRNRYSSISRLQLHHDTGEYIKPTLNERFKTIEGCKVQRDLYSAFLICHTRRYINCTRF